MIDNDNTNHEELIARNMFADSQRWRHGARYGFPARGPQGMAYGIPASEPTWVAWTTDGAPEFGATPEEAVDKAMGKGGAGPMPAKPPMPRPMPPDMPPMMA